MDVWASFLPFANESVHFQTNPALYLDSNIPYAMNVLMHQIQLLVDLL